MNRIERLTLASGFINLSMARKLNGFQLPGQFEGGQPKTARLGRARTRRSDLRTKGETDVLFKGLIAATASVALMVTPAVASAQRTAQVAAASTQIAPSDETVTDGSQLRGGFVIPLIALIAVILGLCAAFCSNDDDQLPHSP